MKTQNIIKLSLALLLLVGLILPGIAQNIMNNDIVKEHRITEPFNKIETDNYFNIFLEKGDESTVMIETNKDFQNAVTAKVVNGVLMLSAQSTPRVKVLNIHIIAPKIEEITLSGNSSLSSKNKIEQHALTLKTFGTSMISLDIEVEELITELHGASEIVLEGTATNHTAELQGATKLIASKLLTDNTTIETNGTSKAYVNTLKKLDITSTANSRVEYENTPQKVNRKNTDRVYKEYSFNTDERDNARLNLGNLDISYNDFRDSTHIRIGRHWFSIDEYGNARYRRMYRDRFNSNWAGLLLGINGYLTPNHDMDFPQEYDYLDLNLAKSIRVDLNIFEQNIRLTKDNHLGLATGLGIEIRNYHFEKNVSLIADQPEIEGYYNEGIYISKSKLTASYVNIPFILEYQTNSYSNRNSFHISTGMVFGLRIGSHTKIKFEEKSKDYLLIDPVSGDPVYTRTSPNKKRVKEFGAFHLNPFKADAMFTIGWGWINLYATYSLTTLFKEGQGPELYPFSIGISLLKW